MKKQANFISKEKLTKEQLTDPDFRLKQLQKKYGGEKVIGCSRCHHCR